MRGSKGVLKVGFSLLFLAVLVLSGINNGIYVRADKNTTAITIKLAKTEGNNITMTNASGKKLTIKNNMKIYSGYTIQTKSDSYAYLYLDDTKAIKLDQNTKATVKKQGSKNEIDITKGKIFFNVTKKLKSTEKLTIRTSNITMGIRGTCGIIAESNDEESSSGNDYVQIYEGSCDVIFKEQESETPSSFVVNSGSNAIASADTKVTKLTLDQIPAVALSEFLNDNELLEIIMKELGFTREQIEAQLERCRAKERKRNEEKWKMISQLEEQLKNEDGGVKYEGDSKNKDKDKDKGNGGYNGPSYKLDISYGISQYRLQWAFSNNPKVILHGTGTVSTTDDLIIPRGCTLTVPHGVTFKIRSGDTITNNGYLVNYGNQSLYCYGELINSATGIIQNDGKFEIVNGVFTNYGLINNKPNANFITSGTFINQSEIKNNGSYLNLGTFINNGSLANNGEYKNCGTFDPGTGSIIGDPGAEQWRVEFYDQNDQLIKSEYVDRGQHAAAPEITGEFTGWSEPFHDVSTNLQVKATTDSNASCNIGGNIIGFKEVDTAYEEAAKVGSQVTLYTDPSDPVTWYFSKNNFELDLTGLTLNNIRISVLNGADVTIRNGVINGSMSSEGELIRNEGSLTIIGTKINYQAASQEPYRSSYYGIYSSGLLITENMELIMENSNIYNKIGIICGVYLQDGFYTVKSGTQINVTGLQDEGKGMKPNGVIRNGSVYTVEEGASNINIIPDVV